MFRPRGHTGSMRYVLTFYQATFSSGRAPGSAPGPRAAPFTDREDVARGRLVLCSRIAKVVLLPNAESWRHAALLGESRRFPREQVDH